MACSLNTMLQKELKNEGPEAVLRQCPEADRVLVENIKFIRAQASCSGQD
jgi:hypothetical protein